MTAEPISTVQTDSAHPGESRNAPSGSAVSFARKYDRISSVGRRSKGLRDRVVTIIAMAVFMSIFALVPAAFGVRMAIALTVCMCVLLLAKFPRLASRDERAHWRIVPDTVHRRDRVGCVGSPNGLALLARRGSIDDTAFEPAVFHALMGLPLRGREWIVWVGLSIGISAGLLALFANMARMGMIYIAILIGIGIAALITAALWPTYLRLVPGRLDILRYNTLGRNVTEVIKHDLRTSAVLVDLNQRCVFLVKDGITTEIGFGAVRDPNEFAHAVLTAAVSTHDPAPLPDDALVG